MTGMNIHQPRLVTDSLTVAYGDRTVLGNVDLNIPDGGITAIVGPNGCGKSTLLKTIARVLTPRRGTVLLDGRAVHRLPTREVAREIGLLPQDSVVPDQLTVTDLVARGRYPHRGAFGRWTAQDQAAIEAALDATSMTELRDRTVDQLSGGQRQRAWIAMVLAQETPMLLLDEPTTFLDLAHRIEVLRLLRRLNLERGVTVVMVLHDLHEAARHAHQLVAMADGRIVAEGDPMATLTPTLVHEVFGIRCTTVADPVCGAPLIVPLDDQPAHDQHSPSALTPTSEQRPSLTAGAGSSADKRSQR